MLVLAVTREANRGAIKRVNISVMVAFLIIYFVWGSTFLAIRVAVTTVPPLFAAGVRFTIAGAVLVGWSVIRREPLPAQKQWSSLFLMGVLMFFACYSALFWAQKFVDSGIAAVLEAMIPVWTALMGILFFRQRVQKMLVVSIMLGIAGVSLLAFDKGFHRAPLGPCLAILGAEISWSLGTVLAQRLPLPESKTVNAGWQMLFGGIMLFTCSGVAGELRPFPTISWSAAGAIAYLIVAGSLIAFTAYIWLLGRFAAPVVASYAYVNPAVALALGHWLAHEVINGRVIMGSALVLGGVLVLMLPKMVAGQETFCES
jgi:drug/metabolite transporter (DMT)-like permease